MEDYAIVIPSKGRPHSALKCLSMVPRAVVYVDERDVEEYSLIPKSQLRTHVPTKVLPEVRNLLLQDFSQPCLVQMDDDFRGVRCLIRRKTQMIREPSSVLALIENNIQLGEDLDIGLLGWNRSGNRMLYFDGDPMNFVSPIFGTWVVRGKARSRLFDPAFFPRADVDYVMRSLVEDRIVFCDRRFYFDHGSVFSGIGGATGSSTQKQYEDVTKQLAEKWGKAIEIQKGSLTRGRTGGGYKDGFSLRVIRKDPAISSGM